MAKISSRVLNYVPKSKGSCKGKSEEEIYYSKEDVKDLMHELANSMKSVWGKKWYKLADAGLYDGARKEIGFKPDCRSKVVALHLIDDLEMLRKELRPYGVVFN